jgi:glutamyl-tRNA synthetase
LKIFSDILLYGTFFFRDPEYDVQALEKRLHKAGLPSAVAEFAGLLHGVEAFDAAALEAQAKLFCETKDVKIGDLNHALRVAVSGVMVGPGLFDMLAVLGRDEVLRRIAFALQYKA